MAASWVDFKSFCWNWLSETFGPNSKAETIPERQRRFLEEALELCQSLGLPQQDAHTLVDYVYNRPVGEVHQELGGTMVTLAALSQAIGIDALNAGWDEINRCYQPEIMDVIRKKQVTKLLHGVGGTPPSES